jgi:hypothetical protein
VVTVLWAGQVEESRFSSKRHKEHNRHTRLAQTDKSAVAEHSIDQERIIELQDTKQVCKIQTLGNRPKERTQEGKEGFFVSRTS